MRHASDKPLRTSLILLLIFAMLVTLSTAGSIILLIRLPQIAKTNLNTASYQAKELATRVDVLLDGLEARVHMISRIVPGTNRLSLSTVMDNFVDSNDALEILYIISPEGAVIATGLPPDKQVWRVNIFDVEFASSPLYQIALQTGKPAWSDNYASALTGKNTIAVAVPYGQQVVIAEIPVSYILSATQHSAGDPNLSTWVLNKRGEVLVDTESRPETDRAALKNLSLIKTALANEPLPDTFTYQGKRYHPAKASSSRMGWIFLAKMPAGLDNPAVRSTLTDLGALLVASVIGSLLLAPWWAGRMIRPVQALIEQAHEVARGKAPDHWPRGPITEFNRLSTDLEQMAETLQEREQKFLAIFNDTPVAIAVSDPQNHHAIAEVNDAWVQQFGHAREAVKGKTGQEIGLWRSGEEAAIFSESTRLASPRLEAHLFHKNGQELLCLISSRQILETERPLSITVMEDVTELRRVERELRDLTIELEERVKQRTLDLAQTNGELMQTLTHLRQTQSDLVQAEKLAALGRLVAGVAHELNTPIGNGLMAASILSDQSRDIELRIKQGLHRSELESFVRDVSLAAELASRNLKRAAELVNSFKQVSVDQTSSQRRAFNLKSVIDEMLLTLSPTFKHTPYRVTTEVPDNVEIDSYPGPLGQALTNLISNALLHGFENRDHGTIQIKAEQPEAEWINITVSDDGNGIATELQDKIFTPFFTTKMGRGGTGLGLHIVHNVTTNILGGTITVNSEPRQGTRFTLHIPQTAPALSKTNGK
ncbi:MAG: multi-sensor signal transduction histidine kinase [Proteobacteria bacterium]|nr:multi-sensor signal transduction histidine kinase [Pseudomonadota bacterium]